MLSLSTVWKILRDLGPLWVAKRIELDAQLRFGILERRLPLAEWDFEASEANSLTSEPVTRSPSKFFFHPDRMPLPKDGASACQQADRVLAGEWPYFSHSWFRVGFPPDWCFNSLNGTRGDDRLHWSKIDLGAIPDVKFVWEPSRFSVVFLLARAYAANRDQRYAEAFWTLVEDWAVNNPPNRGVNWASGQEAALRVMAWCFGLHAFQNSSSSTNERIRRLIRMIEVHGQRIAGFIDYALSQRNNHGIGEAVGLFTIGTLFPELGRAAEWLQAGRQLIVHQLRQQIYADGSYIQHSFNYERVLLDEVTWALRLGELNNAMFPVESYRLLGRAVEFMLRFCDLRTGRMPNYGANDGSLVLPLSSRDYTDFRPSIQAAHFLVKREFCYGAGAWNEPAEWLFAEEFLAKQNGEPTRFKDPNQKPGPTQSESHCGTDRTGYLKLDGRESYAMLRAAEYKDRPSQADQLHLDIWWRGENIACDAGTYLYNGSAPWANPFAGSAVHNTVTVADRDQMTRYGRFLWLDWAQSKSVCYQVGEELCAVDAWHDGYRELGIVHRRSVMCVAGEDAWIVIDDIDGSFCGRTRLHWMFPDYRFTWRPEELALNLQTPAGEFCCRVSTEQLHFATLVRAGEVVAGLNTNPRTPEESISGWRSLYYGAKEPALSLAIEADASLPIRFVTVLAPTEVHVLEASNAEVRLHGKNGKYVVVLNRSSTQRTFAVVSRSESPP